MPDVIPILVQCAIVFVSMLWTLFTAPIVSWFAWFLAARAALATLKRRH